MVDMAVTLVPRQHITARQQTIIWSAYEAFRQNNGPKSRTIRFIVPEPNAINFEMLRPPEYNKDEGLGTVELGPLLRDAGRRLNTIKIRCAEFNAYVDEAGNVWQDTVAE